jgi:hypothetical protein
MRHLVIATALMIVAYCGQLPPALAAEPRDGAIQSVITRQIEAFRRDDAGGAFAFASPTIQGIFGDADNFIGMVRRGYPQVYRPRAYSFAGIEDRDGRLYQRVRIEGPDGKAVIALYEMIEIDGQWRINGVSFAEPDADA